MRVNFWGTRGSIPTPGPETVRYGGNTPCIELDVRGTRIILDAGSGIRRLGLSMLKEPAPLTATLFLTHSHWDHIQGFPFFSPAYKPGNRFAIAGPSIASKKLDQILSDQMERVYFPVEFSLLNAELEFIALVQDPIDVGPATVDYLEMNHTFQCLGYRVRSGGSAVVYMTDNEIGLDGGGAKPDAAFIDFVRNADILIHDAQYSSEEYRTRRGWGHSDYTLVVRMAVKAGVKRLALFHYDPTTDDDEVDRRVRHSQEIARELGSRTVVLGAREGLSVDI